MLLGVRRRHGPKPSGGAHEDCDDGTPEVPRTDRDVPSGVGQRAQGAQARLPEERHRGVARSFRWIWGKCTIVMGQLYGDGHATVN